MKSCLSPGACSCPQLMEHKSHENEVAAEQISCGVVLLTCPYLQRAVSFVHMLVVPVLSSQGLPNGCALAQQSVIMSFWSLLCDPFLAVRGRWDSQSCASKGSLLGDMSGQLEAIPGLLPHHATKHANCTFTTSSQPLCFIRTALEKSASI